MSAKENIRVVCRLRPENKIEKEGGHKICVSYSQSSIKINIETEKRLGDDGNQEFTFDRIFGPDSRQCEVFEYSAKPIIQSVMDGYNGTLLCYGQTSSGKTFTMEGVTTDNELKGIIPRMIESVFDYINNSPEDIEFSVKSSFIEIYNEKIQDLLDPRKTNLLVKEEKEKGIWVQDCTEIFVGCSDEINEVFKIGANNRSIAATCMNERSSRSHSIFILTIFQRNNKTESTKTGKLFLVDLAGSEKQKKTKATGNELEEAKNINKSLLNLGIVINSLSEGKNSYIPYRDSKLTRILQDSLGGNSLTTLIATCSMSSYNDKETLSTIRFANRAKNIRNKPIVNTERSAKELTSKLNSAEEKIKNFENVIQELQYQIDNINRGGAKFSSSSSTINTTNSSNLGSNRCEDCGNAMVKILNQHIEIVGLVDELDKLKVEKNELDNEIKLRNEEIYELNEKLLLSDLQYKLCLEEEAKNYKEIQTKSENAFIMNQKKIIETNNLRNLIEKMRFEVSLVLKTNQIRQNNKNKEQDEFSDLENEKMNKIKHSLEEAYGILIKLDNYIYVNSCLLSESIEVCCKKNVNNINGNEQISGNNSHLNNDNNNSSLVKNNTTDMINRSLWEHEFKRLNNQYDQNHVNNTSKNLKKSKSFSYLINGGDKMKKGKKKNREISVNEKLPPMAEINVNTSFKRETKTKMKLDLSKLAMEEVKNNETDLITSQRKTMLELSLQFKQLQENFSSQQKELEEKEKLINSSNEKTQILIDEYEERLKRYNNILTSKEREFNNYKDKTMKDFTYKENQILELHNKIAFLEDEKFRLLHLDKDKKKFYAMELQINQLTNEMQKLCQENQKFKQMIEKKDEELKILNEKNSNLEKKLVESTKTKLKTVDLTMFKNMSLGKNSESGTFTPVTKPTTTTLQFQTLNEILSQKLSNIERRESANSSFHSGHNKSKSNSPISTLGNTNKIMKIVKGKGSSNQFQIVTIHKQTSNVSPVSNPNNIKPLTPTNDKNNEKVNYFNYHSNNVMTTQQNNLNNGNNGFYSKLLQNPNDSKRNSEFLTRVAKGDKLTQEMKLLDEDFGEDYQSPVKDMSYRKEKQYILPQKVLHTGKNNNVGFLSLFTKFIQNK